MDFECQLNSLINNNNVGVYLGSCYEYRERQKDFQGGRSSSHCTLPCGIFILFLVLMLAFPNIVPTSETYGSFWIKNLSLLIAAFAFAFSALAATYNALEQRSLRYMENYPYLELFPVLLLTLYHFLYPK